MKYKMIASDLDGTLLTNERTISERTIKAIKSAKEFGIKFVISTGRSLPGIKTFEKYFDEDIPVITYNGAVIAFLKSKKIIYERPLETEDAKAVFEKYKEYKDVTLVVWSKGELFANEINERTAWYEVLAGMKPQLIVSEEELLERGITKILWISTEERTDEIETKLSEELCTFCKSQPFLLEFFDKRVSKAKAMERLGEVYGIKREEMVAFGDAENDIPMIEYAGLGVAMGNAKEKIKQVSDVVTDTNENDGVAKVIEKIAKNGDI